MKVIILAAGQGTRLRPYTNDRPKCMVSLYGKPLLHHQLAAIADCGIKEQDISIVSGYLSDKIVAPNIKKFYNTHYASTNMVETLFSAIDFMDDDDDLVISYGDIIYKKEVLNALLESDGEIVIAADKDWYKLWSLRMENPLDDAETFKISSNGFVTELGKVPASLDEVDAQYMGLIKVSKGFVSRFKEHYNKLDRSAFYDGKDFRNMYMTSFLQSLINTGWRVSPCLVRNGWLEVDTAEELELYEKARLL